jgi:hypothetical protein
VTGPAITVTALMYARIASDGLGFQLRVRFPSGEADRLAAMSEKLIRQHAPRNQFAIIVAGRVISAPRKSWHESLPAASGSESRPRDYAEHLLRRLRRLR